MRQIKQNGILLILILTFSMVSGQNSNFPFGIRMNISTYEFQGYLGSEIYRFRDVQGGGGISLDYYLSAYLDLGLGINTGSFDYYKNPAYVKSTVVSNNLDVRFKFYNGKTLRENAFIGPYVIAGTGITQVRSRGVNLADKIFRVDKSGMHLSLGFGLRFLMYHNLSAFIQTRHYTPFVGDFDGNDGGDHFMEHSFGLIFTPGTSNDEDHDGVRDSKDLCPGTPRNVLVDKKGCPLDSDNDGIPDYQDEKPLMADQQLIDTMLVSSDSDGDGVIDELDFCPLDSGSVDADGCPDEDADGIPDYVDECPGTAPGVLVNYKGCPRDWDRDGVPDTEDQCPKTAGTIENNGCPETDTLLEARIKTLSQAIQFEFASTELTESSKHELDEMIQILKEKPEILMRIEGHTDNKGSVEYNLALSQERANATMQYLLQHGISASRLKAAGFGEALPVGDNNTEAGRALNRRVEFRLSYVYE